MGFIEAMKERQMLAQVTHEEELGEHLTSGKRSVYCGFDPTADSFHVGSLVQIMALRRWQQFGHRVIALVGGGTGLIGDPTGKTEMRQMLTEEKIAHNIECFRKQFSQFLDFSDDSKAKIINNADWLKELGYLEVLREIGPHFSVNRMLSAECFKSRLEKGLSFLEFNYMILQSYDFLHLCREEECTVQMGGDDQWSNMLGGVELIRRLTPTKAFCITLPLLTTSSGKKMGKTESGAVWLDPHKTSPYEYYQYWRNIEDAMVEKCFMIFTDVELAEVRELAKAEGAAINQAKARLAFECTKMLHGEEEAKKAEESTRQLFSGGGGAGAAEPTFDLSSSQVDGEPELSGLLVELGIFASKGEVRRLIKQNGLAINGKKVENTEYKVSRKDFEDDSGLLLKKGKKHYYRLKISD